MYYTDPDGDIGNKSTCPVCGKDYTVVTKFENLKVTQVGSHPQPMSAECGEFLKAVVVQKHQAQMDAFAQMTTNLRKHR